MFGFLGTIQAKIIAGLLLVALIGGAIAYIYNKGEKAGSSGVTTAVQKKAAETIDAARTDKEKANEAVRSKPIDVLIDGQLR